ncbi:SusD/RagB family nutrient-binding outer membrane lipoprotein, partial [Flavobacteriaceae bacterium]|nr:SusD/RagB family nutrient-binding outer membrane lipoprotein [Flavobacteriaceae bacterium]
MKNIFKKFSLLTLTTLFVFGCSTVDFGDENVNPNSPTNKKTDALLTNAITAIPGIVSAVAPNYYPQTLSDITYTTYSRYDTYQWNYDGFYTGPLNDLKEIIDLNTNSASEVIAFGDNNNQMAIAHILQVYMYHHMTDRWGAIPYSQALKGADNISPALDQQQDVYTGLFAQLEAAMGY